jgi:hypothetical protein
MRGGSPSRLPTPVAAAASGGGTTAPSADLSTRDRAQIRLTAKPSSVMS